VKIKFVKEFRPEMVLYITKWL